MGAVHDEGEGGAAGDDPGRRPQPPGHTQAAQAEEQGLQGGSAQAEPLGRQGASGPVDPVDLQIHDIVEGIAGAHDERG